MRAQWMLQVQQLPQKEHGPGLRGRPATPHIPRAEWVGAGSLGQGGERAEFRARPPQLLQAAGGASQDRRLTAHCWNHNSQQLRGTPGECVVPRRGEDPLGNFLKGARCFCLSLSLKCSSLLQLHFFLFMGKEPNQETK